MCTWFGCKTKQEVTPPRTVVSEAEKELYALYGLKDESDYIIYDTPLSTLPGHLSTFEGGFKNKDTLVMIHGYGASNAFWFKVMPELLKKFHVYALDMYGFGGSHRPDETIKSTEHGLEIYTKSIEEWRVSLNLTEFYILGHSLGAYLTNHYLHRYGGSDAFKVNGVFMLSPAGSTAATPEEKEEFNNRFGWFKGSMIKLVGYLIFDRHWSPLSLGFFMSRDKAVGKFFGGER
jgi:pimeloyl-ACP methyl ester carboxylesterase